jgi:hypothetical protein
MYEGKMKRRKEGREDEKKRSLNKSIKREDEKKRSLNKSIKKKLTLHKPDQTLITLRTKHCYILIEIHMHC